MIVASRYGFDTRSELMFNVTPFSVSGAAIKSAEMNWLETFPGTDTSPPIILPDMVSGGLPSFEEHLAPSDSSVSSNGFMGLFLRLSSPVRTVLPSLRAAIADAIRIVVPEFDASTARSVVSNLSTPITSRWSLSS